jgi:hypothetical protein
MGTYVIKTHQPIPEENLKAFLDEVSPNAMRIKGFVNTGDGKSVAVQSCFGKTTIKEITGYQGPTELIGMGYGIDHASFGRRFRHFQAV